MHIMVIDKESLTNQLIVSKLAARGHQVAAYHDKNEAFAALAQSTDNNKAVDCIILDPAPLAEARPVVIACWKNIRSRIKPYILLLSKTASAQDAILAGTNDVLHKPLAAGALAEKIDNAARLQDIAQHLSSEDDIHSGNGMIGKNAFNQMFLSACDRAFRYAEYSLLVFIRITNHEDMRHALGPDAFEKTLRALIDRMTFMRRQSDVIGRIGAHEFAIMLQRPQCESEPLDAINRFAETLGKFRAEFADPASAPKITLELVSLPQGALCAQRSVPAT